MRQLFLKIILMCFLVVLFSLSIVALEPIEAENNNSLGNSNVLEPNTSISGTIENKEDEDWYKIVILRDGYINLELSHSLTSSSQVCWQIWLYDENGNTVDGTEGYTAVKGTEAGKTPNFGLCAGTYYAKVKAEYHSKDQYTLKANYEKVDYFEKEQNNSKDNATVVEVNKPYTGALTSNGEEDWYKLTITSAKKLGIVLSHREINDPRAFWRVSIYDSTLLVEIMTIESKGESLSSLSNYKQLPAGDYYVKVTKKEYSNIDYVLSINEEHLCSGEFIVVQKPTCTQEGDKEKPCNVCGKIIETGKIEAMGHKANTYSTEKQASCTEDGFVSYKCTVCNENIDEVIPKLPHPYGEWTVLSGSKVIPPIVREKTCSVCGDIVTHSDYSYVWLTVVASVVAVGVAIGIVIGAVNYFKSLKEY